MQELLLVDRAAFCIAIDGCRLTGNDVPMRSRLFCYQIISCEKSVDEFGTRVPQFEMIAMRSRSRCLMCNSWHTHTHQSMRLPLLREFVQRQWLVESRCLLQVSINSRFLSCCQVGKSGARIQSVVVCCIGNFPSGGDLLLPDGWCKINRCADGGCCAGQQRSPLCQWAQSCCCQNWLRRHEMPSGVIAIAKGPENPGMVATTVLVLVLDDTDCSCPSVAVNIVDYIYKCTIGCYGKWCRCLADNDWCSDDGVGGQVDNAHGCSIAAANATRTTISC